MISVDLQELKVDSSVCRRSGITIIRDITHQLL